LLDHPGTVYLREADLLPHPDGWLTGLFHPATLDVTLDALIGLVDLSRQSSDGTGRSAPIVDTRPRRRLPRGRREHARCGW
jgi:hypothetical protein